MDKQPLRILLVSTSDLGGGAEKVAWNLFKAYQNKGFASRLAVGRKYSADSQVFSIPNDSSRNSWARTMLALERTLDPLTGKIRGTIRLRKALQWLGQPCRRFAVFRGHEDFHFPGTWSLPSIASEKPDILHAHNLHTAYFDLRALPWLSRQVPFIMTLHDAWLLSGHCAHSFDCERWQTGCGHCPDLSVFPAMRRDASAFNWKIKQNIFSQSQLYIAAPCQWLMDKVRQSILNPAIRQAKIIPYGVDLSLFHPVDKIPARRLLRLPEHAKILLFVANGIRSNIWKDYQCLRETVRRIADRYPADEILFLALGEDAPPEQLGRADIHFIPFQKDVRTVASYYQAADLYVHAARADTFPNTVLEALACGTPVIATAIGGIPEQIKSLATGSGSGILPPYDADRATGILVNPGDSAGMAQAVLTLLNDTALKNRLGSNAAADIQTRFPAEKQINAYLNWYREILESRNGKADC